MPTLTSDELVKLRQDLARVSLEIRWTKSEVDAILQAIEDYMDNTMKPGLNSVINGVKSGLTVEEKRIIVKYMLLSKFRRE